MESNNNNTYINKRVYKPVPILDGIQEIKNDFEERTGTFKWCGIYGYR